jgi:drug/metabolite transporter (DMT)-like permease
VYANNLSTGSVHTGSLILIGFVYMHEYLALALVFLSGVGFSVQGLFQKLLSESGFHDTFITVLIQGTVQSLCLGIALLFDEERYRSGGSNKHLLGDNAHTARMLLLRAVLGFGSLAFAFLAFDAIPLGDASVLVMLGPLIAAVMGVFFLGEPFLRSEMIATAFTLTGSVLVAKPPFIFQHIDYVGPGGQQKFDLSGVVCGLLASVCAGGSFVMLRLLGTSAKVDYKNICFVQGVIRLVLAIPAVWLSSQHFGFHHYSMFQYSLMFTSGLIATAAQVSMTLGLQRVKSAVGSTMRMSDIVLSFVFQMLFTRDCVDPLSVMGAFLVLGGILFMLWQRDVNPASATTLTTSAAGDVQLNPMPYEKAIRYMPVSLEEVTSTA